MVKDKCVSTIKYIFIATVSFYVIYIVGTYLFQGDEQINKLNKTSYLLWGQSLAELMVQQEEESNLDQLIQIETNQKTTMRTNLNILMTHDPQSSCIIRDRYILVYLPKYKAAVLYEKMQDKIDVLRITILQPGKIEEKEIKPMRAAMRRPLRTIR